MEGVASLDEDRILHRFLAVIQAMLRTNYFQKDAAGLPKDYLCFKVSPSLLPELPMPRPMFEIFNTDFIDNSGGVDCSDREVNIKIALDAAIQEKMSLRQRNRLLARMKDEVAKQFLQNNDRQARAISVAALKSMTHLDWYARLINVLERAPSPTGSETPLLWRSEGTSINSKHFLSVLVTGKQCPPFAG